MLIEQELMLWLVLFFVIAIAAIETAEFICSGRRKK